MQLKIWENPLVVSAMRLKYRRGSPGLTCSGYLLALLGIGAVIHYNADGFPMPFGRVYLLAIMSFQLLLSGGIGMISVAGSFNAELANRTLDFQRLVALSPRQIVVGKMIGEPAISYFLLLTTIPLALLCSAQGGASFGVIAWLYVNLITFSLMAASIGAITLTPPSQKTGKSQNSGGGWAVFLVLFWMVPALMQGGVGLLDSPWTGNLMGAFTPIASLMHLANGNAWDAEIHFWNVSIPSLVAAPVVELAVAAWAVEHMARRLTNAIDPPVSKRLGYAGLFAFDLAIAGVCYRLCISGESAGSAAAQFAIAHVAASLMMLLFVAPQRPALLSWVWRFRRVTPRWRDLLLGDRRDVSLTVLAFALIGAATMLGGLVVPIRLADADAISWPAVAKTIGVASLLIVSLGLLYQWVVVRAGRSGTLVFLMLTATLLFLPMLAAIILSESPVADDLSQLLGFLDGVSPITFFAEQIDGVGAPAGGWVAGNHGWFVAAYAAIAAGSFWGIQVWLRGQAVVVDRKLQAMGVGG